MWLGPKNFLLVRSELAHASYPELPELSFRPPGFSLYMGREEGEFGDWTRNHRIKVVP